MLISLKVPQRTRSLHEITWNFLFLRNHPSARTLPFSVTSLRTFTFKSFSRCPLHYSTTKTSLCGFLENLKDPFVPYPLLSLSSLLNPFTPAAYLHGRFLFFDVDANCETSHEIPSIILVHALALWSRYESSHEVNYLALRFTFF